MTDDAERSQRRGLDRIKPPEERLLARGDTGRLEGDGVDATGRAALFSHGRSPADEPTGAVVHCSRCGETSPLDASTVVRSALPLFLLAPWRSHPVFAICPACQHRAWLRPGLQR